MSGFLLGSLFSTWPCLFCACTGILIGTDTTERFYLLFLLLFLCLNLYFWEKGPGPKWDPGPNWAQAQMGPGPKLGPGPNWDPGPNRDRAQMGPKPKSGPGPNGTEALTQNLSVVAFSERIGQGNKIDMAISLRTLMICCFFVSCGYFDLIEIVEFWRRGNCRYGHLKMFLIYCNLFL